MRSVLAFLLLALAVAPDTSGAQRLKIAVAIADSATGGIFASGFSAAFRALGDVDVVSTGENPDYVLEGVVLCDPKACEDAVSYSIALRLYEPLHYHTAQFIADLALNPHSTRRTKAADSLAATIWEIIQNYEQTQMTWAATWGRDAYAQALKEFVAEIDSKCLEKLRALNRMGESHAPDRFTTYSEFVHSRDWIC